MSPDKREDVFQTFDDLVMSTVQGAPSIPRVLDRQPRWFAENGQSRKIEAERCDGPYLSFGK